MKENRNSNSNAAKMLLGLVGMAVVAWMWKGQRTGEKAKSETNERREKKENEYRNSPTTSTSQADQQDNDVDEVKQKMRTVVEYVLNSRDERIRNPETFLARFIIRLITLYGDDAAVMEQSPKNTTQLNALVTSLGQETFQRYRLKLEYNDSKMRLRRMKSSADRALVTAEPKIKRVRLER